MFDAELIAVMRGALAQATLDVRPDPSTLALMAERILQSAANGTRSQETFRIIATEAAAEGERLRLLNPASFATRGAVPRRPRRREGILVTLACAEQHCRAILAQRQRRLALWRIARHAVDAPHPAVGQYLLGRPVD
jgi:hypothetical protein